MIHFKCSKKCSKFHCNRRCYLFFFLSKQQWKLIHFDCILGSKEHCNPQKLPQHIQNSILFLFLFFFAVYHITFLCVDIPTFILKNIKSHLSTFLIGSFSVSINLPNLKNNNNNEIKSLKSNEEKKKKMGEKMQAGKSRRRTKTKFIFSCDLLRPQFVPLTLNPCFLQLIPYAFAILLFPKFLCSESRFFIIIFHRLFK